MLGASQILIDFLDPFIPLDIPAWIWPVSIFVVFAILVYFGTEVIDFLNRFFDAGTRGCLFGAGWIWMEQSRSPLAQSLGLELYSSFNLCGVDHVWIPHHHPHFDNLPGSRCLSS